MDKLSDILNNLTVSRSSIETFIDKMDGIDTLGRHRAELEWQTVQEIHSKLIYLNDYFNDPEDPVIDPRLLASLTRYLQHNDTHSIRYIKDIEWDSECELQVEIRELLEVSLNTSDPTEKLDLVVEAYSKMLSILEEFGLFAMPQKIEDPFLFTFPMKRKRT
jgi:hypothetical protein